MFKTTVERYEEQFKTQNLKKRRLFYDLFIKAPPEEARRYCTELLQSLDWKTTLDKSASFEEMDVEGVFRATALKPYKALIKSYKQFIKGPKYPFAWKVLAFTGIILLFLYFWAVFKNLHWNTYILLIGAIGSFVAALLVYLIKDVINMAVWIKLVGVYNVEKNMAELRLILAADAEKADKDAYMKLEEDVAAIYDALARKFGKRVMAKEEVQKVEEGEKFLVKLANALARVSRKMDELEDKYDAGKISKDKYREMKKELKERRKILEAMLELVKT